MKRNVLKANQVPTLPAGVHGDGTGLSLKVSLTGARSWVFRFRFAGQVKEMGLGSAALVPLAVARAKRDDLLQLIQAGKDPLVAKQKALLIPTFDQAAKEFIEAKRPTWKNAKHAQQWENTLETYASPTIGRLQIDKIEPAHVVAVLTPIWHTKNETAVRVRGRIHAVLGAARYRAGLTGINPAEWTGHLENDVALSHRKEVKNFASMHHSKTGELLGSLVASTRVGDLALAFTILTAARTGSVIGARWDEINEDGRIWHVPADRMKIGIAFDIPLSAQALQVLKQLKGRHPVYVFPTPRRGKNGTVNISNMAMASVLANYANKEEATVHGFRSSFRSWAGDVGVDFEVAEESLAHAKANSVVKAYHRTTVLERRRAVMQQWADYLTTEKPAIVEPETEQELETVAD